jgi:LysR family transcriptional regulator, transcriptional activator of nhaA
MMFFYKFRKVPEDKLTQRFNKEENIEESLLKNRTMLPSFSYRHLHYFWVVAKEGSVTRAAARLGMAVQTVSTQVRELERSLGHVLLKPAGRGLALTEAGQAALRQADAIFQLGEELPAKVREALSAPHVRLAIGVSDSLPKLVVRHLMEPVMLEPSLRLICDEDEFDDLLGDLALHRLDIVLSDRPSSSNPNLRLYSHLLASSPLGWYAPAEWTAQARRKFPQSLANVPVLLPSGHAAVRVRIDRWFEQQGISPLVVGEFEDSALLKTFGAGGMGVFPAPELVHADLTERYGVKRIGHCDGVAEHFYAIGTERKVVHPLVQRLIAQPPMQTSRQVVR